MLACISGHSLMAQADTEDTTKSAPTVVEVMPEFPGGQEALFKWLSQNVSYPDAARAENIEGKVYVRFIIDKSGKPGNIDVVRSAHPLLDEEAKRVIALMPDWTPGKQGGKDVAVTYTLPLYFKLPEEKKQEKK
jgi:TonB family protein